jgi:hypothetical protein
MSDLNNNLTFSTQPYQRYEVAVNSVGTQYLGYTGVFGSSLGCPTGDVSYISLVDQSHQTIHFQVDSGTYQLIKNKLDSIHLEDREYLYLWVEESAEQQVENWRLFKTTLMLTELYPLYQESYGFESLYQLIELVESLKIIPLRMFCRQVLNNDQLLKSFVSLPASKRHHHSYPGGLLAHSLECALIVARNLEILHDISRSEKETTIVAALLHDIGKTQTLGCQQHTSIGQLLDHEQFSLLVLAEPLSQLTRYWPKGAETLQYLLTWNQKMGFCRFVGGNIIKLADQLSTSSALRRMAFDGKPDYYHFSNLKIGEQNHYLNRLP